MLRTCQVCGTPFETRHRPGGRYQLYCSVDCRVIAMHKREIERKAEARALRGVPDDDETPQRQSDVKNTELHAKFIYSPAEDGWPAGCSFPLTEIKNTLALGYFPDGAKFKTKKRKLFTVCGKEAVAADGERIG